MTTASDIIREVAKASGVPVSKIRGKRRFRQISVARHCAMYRLREERRLSLTQIARIMGGVDHSSVAYGIERWESHWAKLVQDGAIKWRKREAGE